MITDLLEDALKRLSHVLTEQLEDLFIEGLARKGYRFQNREELESFVRQHCKCEDRFDVKERTYFVKNEPFFLHKYEILPPTITVNDPYTLTANGGYYSFL